MTAKATQFRFQVSSDNNVNTPVSINIDGATVWSGNLPKTVDHLDQTYALNYLSVPFSLAEFNIDVPDFNNNYPTKTLKTCSIAVTGGRVMLVGVAQTNNPTFGPVPDWKNPGEFITGYIGGNPNFTVDYDIDTQPLWNGQAILDRYNINVNFGNYGPGAVFLESGDICEFTLELWCYCPVIT